MMNDPVLIWFLLGIGLMLLELALPGLVLIFFGIAAWIVSLASYLGLVSGLSSQCMLFSIATLVSLALLRKYVKNWFVGESKDEEGELDTEFIGKVVRVTKAIPGGSSRGKIELKGAEWNAFSENPHAVGEMVKVTERDGLNLTVSSK